jgi:acyl-CoA synthetase (AMP-forming)/AMP-acid ligase II
MILVHAGDRFAYGGTRGARLAGRVYPTAEVVAVAKKHPRVIDAAVVLDQSGRFGQPVCILCAFTGAARPEPGEADALARAIAKELGAELVPDHVQLLPLYPRIRGDEPDPRWCLSQQVTGMFYHRPRQEPYQVLTLLRRALHTGADTDTARSR